MEREHLASLEEIEGQEIDGSEASVIPRDNSIDPRDDDRAAIGLLVDQFIDQGLTGMRNREMPTDFNPVHLRSTIAETIGNRQQPGWTWSRRYGEAVAIFLDSLLVKLDERTRMESLEKKKDHSNMEWFELHLSESLFDFETSITTDLAPDQLFDLVLKHQHDVLQTELRRRLEEDLALTLSQANEKELETIVKTMDSQDTSRALHSLELCVTLINEDWNDEGLYSPDSTPLRKIIETVKDQNHSALVRLFADEYLEQYEIIKHDYHQYDHELERRDAQALQTGALPQPITEYLEQHHDPKKRVIRIAKDAAVELQDKWTPDSLFVQGYSGTVRPFSYQGLLRDPQVNPFRYLRDEEGDLESGTTLLQTLHRPDLRARLDRDLGFDITDIPLRAQIQLLRYLGDQDPTGYERIRTLFHDNRPTAPDLANAFFAYGEHEQAPEDILVCAELLSASPEASSKLFRAYASFTSQAEHLAYEVVATAREFSVEMPTNDFTTVFVKILQRGNRLFPFIAEHLKSVEPDQTRRCGKYCCDSAGT